jgi:hypothetical protein
MPSAVGISIHKHSEQISKPYLRLQEPRLAVMAVKTIAQVAEPCHRQTNYVNIGGAHVVIKFSLLGPETSNVLIVNAERGTEIRM